MKGDLLKETGYFIAEIRKRLNEENVSVSVQALFNLVKNYKERSTLLDLPRRTRLRKLQEK